MKNTSLRHTLKRGFSLVEMLVVIAVIGVIAAIAVPNIGTLTSAAKTARDQRNAQSVASVFAAGSAAGVAWDTASADAAVAEVVAGKAPTDGAFTGKVFRVPNLSGADLTAAKAHLTISPDGQLVYSP
jgi:prepilin-type N-terminal cleavage/methylation domain-containing protein